MVEKINHSLTSGEKLKGDRIMSTIESLMNGKNNQKIIENLKMYYDASRGARVSIFHENIEDSGKTMVVTEPVYSKMKTLVEKTSETKKEYAFLVLGWVQDGNFLFNGIASDIDIDEATKNAFYDKNPEYKTGDSAVDFNVILSAYWQAINGYIDRTKGSGLKPLVSLGHTHPNASESYGNYSLPDLVGFSTQEEAIRGNRDSDEVEYCHIILPENGDVDCMTFDKEAGQFKKITNVMSVGQDGEDVVPAYTFKSPESLSETSYVKEENESDDDKIYNDYIEEIIRRHQWDKISKLKRNL